MEIRNINLIFGDEELLKQEKRKELLAAFGTEGGPDHHFFSGKELDLAEVSSLSVTLPLFGTHRTIWIDETGCFKGQGEHTEFLDFLKGIPESCVLILTEADADKSSPLTKYAAAHGELFEFRSVSGIKAWKEANAAKADIRQWAQDQIKAAGCTVEKRALDALLETAGFDMWNLRTEIEKLTSLSGGHIRLSDVEAIVSKTVSDRVFDLIDMKLSGNIAGALDLFEEMQAIRIEPLKIIYLMYRQFIQAYMIKDMESLRFPDAQILSETGLKDWQLRKVREKARRVPADEMRYLAELCTENEYKVKQGELTPKMAVEMILCS